MPNVAEVLAYLGIDESDAMILSNINRAISTTDAFFKGAIGADYQTTDPRIKELALMYIADLYDNRGVSEKTGTNVRRLVNDLLLQLRLELRNAPTPPAPEPTDEEV